MLNRRKLIVSGGLAIGAALTASANKSAQAQTSTVQSISFHTNGFLFDAIAAGPTNGPLVLCLHGFPEYKEAWASVIASLGALGFRAVAVDQRGYSARARPTAKTAYTTAILVSDAMGFATALGATQFHMMGHDWGAEIAWRCAVAHPDQVLSVTAVSSPHPDAYISAFETDPDQQNKSQYLGFLSSPAPAPENALLANGGAALVSAYNGVVPQTEVNLFLSRFQQPGALTAPLNWYREEDLTDLIGPCTVPALHIWGEQDAYNGRVAAQNTANYCSGPFEFVELPNLSHWLLDQAPDAIVTLFQQFLSAQVPNGLALTQSNKRT